MARTTYKFDENASELKVNGTVVRYSDYPNLTKKEVFETAIGWIGNMRAEVRKARRQKKEKKKYIYMYCTKDEYELPLAVGDSTKEIAEILGMNPKTMTEYFSKGLPQCHKILVSDIEYNEFYKED